MKRLNFGNTNNKRIMLALSFALILLATTTLTGTSSLQFIKSAMAKKLITTADIADNAVTSPKIKDGEVTGDDVSPSFMIRKTLHDDDAGHAQNWNPNGISRTFDISDDDISGDENSVFVSIMMKDPPGGTFPPVCSVRGMNTAAGFWYIICDDAPVDGSKLDYTITKLPPNVATSSASVSSSSTPTISSPFSSLGDTPK